MEDAKKVNNTEVSNLLLGRKKKKKPTLIISNIHPPPPNLKPLVCIYNQVLSKEWTNQPQLL